jgi:hypothetical protein
MLRWVIAFAIILFGLSGGSARAQTETAPAMSDDAKAVVGAWEISNADRDKICPVTLGANPVQGGFTLSLDKNCATVFPSTKEIVAWVMDADGTLRLVDAAGNAVLEFTEVESGIYDGFRRDEGRFIMQSAAAAPLRTAAELAGEWAVARGTGKPICLLTLTSTAADADRFALKVKSACDAFVRSFGPATWRMENGELVLYSARGQTWHFEENDANTWQRVPESPDPVLLVRQ